MRVSFIDFNTGARVITALYALYLAVAVSILLYLGPVSFVTAPTQPVIGSLAIFASSVFGTRASRAFGGRRNFTGRLVLYYSVALFLEGISWLLWGFLANGQIPQGLTLIVITASAVANFGISAYVLISSARAVAVGFNRRVLAIIVFALALSIAFSILDSVVLTSLVDRIFWAGLYSGFIFLQLVGGLIMVTSLGKWYMAGPLVNIAFVYVFYSVSSSLVTILRNAFTAQFSEAYFWVVVSLLSATCFYLVGLQMSQVKPRKL